MEKLHHFRDFLQRSDIEPLFKSLSVSQTNWGELQSEILQVIRSTGPRHVREALIQSSTKLLSTEVRGVSEPTSASAAQQSILQGLKRATDVLSSLSKREVLSMGRESQRVLIQALSHLADEESMAQFLTIDVLRDKRPIDIQSGKGTNGDELEQLARHLLARGGLTNHLLLLLILWQSEESSLDIQYFRVVLGLIAEPNRSLLSLPELEQFGSVIKSQESTKLCEGTPRVHIFCGSPSKISRYEFQGQAAASVLGFNTSSTSDQPFAYLEFSVKSKGGSFSNVRVGWGSTKTYFRHPLMNGCDDSHWMLDFGTQQIHYNEASDSEDLPSAYEIGNLFGNDEDDNDEPPTISAAAITPTAAPVETPNTAETEAVAQYLERKDSGKVKWDSGIISCVYNFADSSSLFFINGDFVGRFKTQPNWPENKKDISPIFVGSETSAFDINLGQQPYQYLSQVTTYMDGEHLLSSQRSHHAAAEIVRHAEANFKAYKYLSMGQVDEVGYFEVNDVSPESLKTLTLEVSLRLPSSYTGLDQVVVQTSPTPEAVVADGSLTLGISSQLGVYFEIAGCGGKVVTPKESVPCNSWFHVAVAVSYSKSGGKLQVHIYINGQSAAHGELIPDKNPKGFKMPIKYMHVGCPFEKDRDHSYVGDLCNVRVWGNARGGEKITSLMYKSKLSGSESDLLLFFPCDEGIGLEVHDCSNAKPGGKRHTRIFLQGDIVWGSMSSAHFDSALASIQSGWAVPENNGTDCIDLASTLLDRVKIIQEKGADYLTKGWSSATFSDCGLALSEFLLDFNVQSLELLKCLMVYVLRRAATGVDTKLQMSFEKFLPVAMSILERSLTFFVRQSLSSLSQTLRESLFMVLLFLVNGCSFLSDTISMQLTTSAKSILVSSIELFFPDPVERVEVLHSILEVKLKAVDLSRPLSIRRSSSMDGAHNVQIFIKQDFTIALSSLKPDVRDFVLDVFLDNVRKVTTLDALVSVEFKPKSLVIGNGAASVKDLTKNMKGKPTKSVEHGSFVRRGRHWIYGDEGGSGVGIVLAITKWKEQSNSAAIVLWENNHIGKYRLGYSVTSAEGVSELFDVELLYDDVAAASEVIVEDTANAAVEKATTDASATPHVRNPFSGTVFTVSNVARNLLSLPDSSLSISKRSTLAFIKEIAAESWLEEHGLLDSVNVLVNNFDEMDVFYLFVEFYQRYGPSSKTAVGPRTSQGKLTPKELLLSMAQKLAQSVVLDVESSNDRMVASVDALSALSGMVFGTLSTEQVKTEGDSYVLTKYNVDTFASNTDASSCPWSWTEGIGGDSTEKTKEKAAKKTTMKVVEHVLDTFPIMRVPTNIQTRQRGKGLEVSVHDVREWSTLVFDTPMLPNSGIYRWYMKVKFSERRGQILLGLCTEKSSPSVQLGVNDESWGVSPNIDVYHSNQKRSVNLSTSKKISSGSILEFCVDTYEGTFSFTELSSGMVSRFGGKEYDVCRNAKLRQEILFPAISLSNPGDSVLLVGDASDLKMLQSRMGSLEDRPTSTTDDKGTPSTVILGCPTPVAMEVFRTNIDYLTKLWERCLPEIDTLTALPMQVGLPLLITLSSMCKWGHVAVEDRMTVSKESLSFLKLGLAILRQLDLRSSEAATTTTIAAREGEPSSLREWRSLTLQLIALVVELLGKVIVEAARAPALGSSFNEYLDIGGGIKIESSYAMKSAYSKSLGSDLFVHGWNENPMTLQPTTVISSWLQTLLGSDFSFENCDEAAAWFVQILLFHIGMEGLIHKAVDTAHGEHAGIVTVVVEQVKAFVRQFAALPDTKRTFATERLLLATKCVRSPNQASIVVDGDDSDHALSSILTTLSEEIVTFVFSEYVYASVIESLLVDREYQANTKAAAFEQAKTILLLLEGETVQAIKTMFLDQLAAGLNGPYEVFAGILKENSNSTSWHYFDGLNGASVQAGKKLRASFASFISYLIAELSSLAEIGSERTVLAVLGTLATKVIIFDHESLARSQFFAALEEIINAEGADASPSKDSEEDLPGQVVTVATKVFIMMALQVASGGKRSVKDRSLPSPSIQRAVSLERMRSGPATLNKTVFDLVQRLLRRAIDRLPTPSSSSSSSTPPSSRKSPDSLFECVTILLNVAIDEETQKVIATPEWFSLLLELVFVADVKYRHRSFAVLAELLPGMGSIANSDWNKLRSLDGRIGSAFPWDNCAGKQLPLMMILHIIGTFASIPFSLHKECPFLEDGGKIVDQYQSLMAVVTEGVNLYRSLLVAHEPWKTDAMNALIAALGDTGSIGGDVAGSVPTLVLGALAVFDGYFVCIHQYSMVACPLSGETFIGVITGYMDSAKERVEASGVLVGPDTLHAKYDRKQDMKKMVAAASVLMPIHKTLTSSLPINTHLIQAAMKCFERFERFYTQTASSARTNNGEPKMETKEEDEDGGRPQESKDEGATQVLPPSSLVTTAGSDSSNSSSSSGAQTVSAELLEYFRTIFSKFFLAILTHPEFSTSQLWEITATSEFQFFWSKTMAIASTTCRTSDLGVFSNLEEHFHDLAVILGTKQLQSQSKDATGNAASSSSGDAKSAAGAGSSFEPAAMSATSSAVNPTTPTPASAPRSPNTLGVPSELVESLINMGFPRASCIVALERSGGDFEEALNILLSEPPDESYDMAQEDEEEVEHLQAVHEPPSSASEAKTMEEASPTNVGEGGEVVEGDENDEHGDDDEEEDGDEEEDEEEDDGGDSNEYHYRQEPAGRALPFHVAPDFASDRIGCLFPGDDIHVIEERVVDGVKWLSFHMADFDNSNYSSTYGDDFFQYLVWAPTVVNGTTVIFDGVFQHDMETDFSDVVFEPASIDRWYRVIGSKGALVRVGVEIGTEEQAMLESGTVVHAFEESFNAEGTVRIHIDQPVRGWMSKLIGLVERVPDTVMPTVTASATSSSTAAAAKVRLITSEYDLQIDDNLDGLSGNDIFTKEDRFFANMQGRRFDFLERADGTRLLGGAGRRRKLTLPSATSSSISEVQQLLMKTVVDVGGLTARKCLLLLVSRWAAERSSSSLATAPLAPVAWTQSPTCAETLLKCLRLLLFRGDVHYLDGYQRFLFHGGDFLQVLKQPLSVEDALLVIADKIVMGDVFVIPNEAQAHFREMFLDAIQKNLKQACEARYSDHSWEDTAQEASPDSEILSSPSVNYALWLTLILSRSQDEETLMKLIITWVQTVKAASMSLKCIAYRMSVHLLDVSRSLSPALRDAVRLHTQKIVSLRRLSSFAVKRLWQEMEDAPQYSRFMQALTALLFQLTDVFSNKASSTSLSRASSVTVAGTTGGMMTPTVAPPVSSSQCVRFKRYESHLQFSSQKDLSAPWSLRVRLCRRHFVSEQYEPYVRTEKDGHGSGGNGNGKSTGNRAGREYKLHDMIKLLTGEGMDEREKRGRVSPVPGGNISSSSSATAETTKTSKATPLSEFYLHPSYLLLSSRAFVKIQKGGRTFVNQVLEDPADVAADTSSSGVEIFDEALCVSVGQSSSEERSFNVVIPYDRWVDVVLVCDQPAGITSLYIDGQLQESMQFTFNLPLTTVGSSKAGYSFAGDISHFQVWNYAKSAMEVSKDFAALTQGHGHVTNKPLIHLVYSADSVDGLFDEMGMITGMKAHDCVFVDVDNDTTGGSSLSPLVASANDKANATFLVTADNIDTSDAVELTGYIRVPKSGKKPPLSNGIEDIVVLRYQLGTTSTTTGVNAADEPQHVVEMHGTLTWSEKQVKMRLQGTYHRVTHVFTLHGHGSDVLSGPPEKIAWLRGLKLQGSIRDGVFEGDCFLDLKLDVSPSQPLGTVRLDMASLPPAVEAVVDDERVFSIVKVKPDSTDGQYVAYFTVQPYRLGEYLSYGLMKGQGSVWIDWQIKASSGNIAFGWTTHSALSHPDASVDANRGTWTYSTSGQASHGDDLYLCDSADEGDIVSLQLNTNTGLIRVFKNYELILVFEHVCDDVMLTVNDQELGEVGKRGIRPFVSVVSPDDCVQLLGAKEGPVDITFPETDAFARCKLIGRVVRGAIEGVALVSKDTNSRWEFGHWTNDCANGVHIEISDIRAETIDVVAVRRYVQDTEDVPVPPAAVEDLTVGSTVVQRLVEQFYDFRREHAQRGCSLFARAEESLEEGNASSTATQAAMDTTETMTSHDETPAVTSDDGAATPQITVSVSAHAPDVVTLTVPLQRPLQAMMEAFAARNSAYYQAFQFKLGDTVLNAEDTAEAAGLTDGCAISAATRSFTYEDNVDDPVTKYFPLSTAPYIVMIIYEGGATVRDRIEIDDNSRSLRIIRRGEIVEAFQKSMTSDGIGRFKIADGWISERLRGGTEEPVVRILKQRFELTGPLTTRDLPQYRILRDEGAKLRAEAAFTSEDIGLCPQHTVVSIDEKRMVRNEAESNVWTSRLHVLEPAAHCGWISEKDKLIEKLTDGAFAGVDAAIQMEIARRNKLRASKPSWSMFGRSSTTNTQSQLLRLKAEVSLSAEVPFLLRKSRHCENLHVSKDFTTVTCPENCSGRQVILGSKGFSHGVHYWEVHVKSANWGTVFIGVAPEDASGWNGMGFINYRATQAFGSETLYGNYYGVNDKIGVLLDMDRGTLTFFKDGEDFNVGRVTVVNMGVAYRNVRKSAGRHSSSPMLYPCFGVKTPGDCLSIKDTHWMSYSGVDSTQTMQRALQALSFVQAWKSAYASSSMLDVSPAAVQAMYDDYGHKCSPHFFTTDARPGLPVQLLVSHEALTTAVGESLVNDYGLHVGCNLTTVYGPASLLGVSSWSHGAGWRVWYSCEKNGKRAWYWTVAELREALQGHTVEVLSELLIPISHRQESFNAIDRDSRLSQEAFVQLVTASLLVSPTSSPAVAAATEVSSPSSVVMDTVAPWTYDEDCALVDAVNKVAIRHDHDAASLSAHMVQRYLEQQHLLTDRSATEIHVRYTALCLLNRCLAIVLPLLDLSMADVHRSLLIVNASSSSSSLSSSSSSGAHWRPGCSLLAVPSPLRDLVLSMKQIIFTQTKQQVWSLAVKETTVATALPADEYERPDEIREITVNSLKGKHYRSGLPPLVKQFDEQEKMFERWAHQQPSAATSAASSSSSTTLLSEWVKEIDERIRVSVFGQLLDAFSTWDDRVLRKAYVHMQDAGQARAFFVKLAGEGVDDQGGPYRAVFQTAIGEDITHLLPVLVPSDNQAQGVGADRDRFVFNLSLLSHHPRGVSLLQHLGKLVGVAVRHRIQVPLPLASYLFQALCFEVVSVREAMMASQAPLVHSLKALVDMVSDTDGAIFSLEEREEAADFLAEALVKSVKRLQTTSRAVWSTLVTSAIGGSSSSSSSSGGSGSSSGTAGGGASLANFAMSLSDVSESTLRAMVFATLQLPLPTSTTTTTTTTATSVPPVVQQHDRFASVTEILDTIFAFHLLAQNEALQLFFQGLSQVLPTELCALFTAEELESVISGAQEVDFDVLQQATVYDGVAATDPHIELFWDAVRSLDTEEQALFVNFCSGRSRLPASASDFPMSFKLTAPPATSTEQPDRFLPVARTCFFSLSLPKYSSLDICREKLRYAIRHTEVMDADFVDRRGASAWDALPTAPTTTTTVAAENGADVENGSIAGTDTPVATAAAAAASSASTSAST